MEQSNSTKLIIIMHKHRLFSHEVGILLNRAPETIRRYRNETIKFSDELLSKLENCIKELENAR